MSARDRVVGRFKPSLVALGLTLFALGTPTTAQAPVGPATPADLFGSSAWQVESVTLAGEPFALDAEVFTELVLAGDLPALTGTVGCNRMTARFELGPEPGAIAFSPIVSTLMACPEPAMSQERAVFDALEAVEAFTRELGRVRLSGPGVEVVLAARTPGALGSTPPRQVELDAFNGAVTAAAAAGAQWPSDPLRVALAFVDLSGAAQTSIVARYGPPDALVEVEGPREVAVVTVDESGLLDDSVSGVTQRVLLDREGDVWLVTGHEIVWQCARGPEAQRVEPLRCP